MSKLEKYISIIYKMVNTYTLEKSKKKNKKFVIIMDNNMSHHFGDDRYEDYTKHNDIERKKRYITRTIKQPQDNIHSPAFWSLNLLWNKPTLEQSIKNVEKKYNIKIINKIN